MNDHTNNTFTMEQLQEIGMEYHKMEQQQKIDRYRILNEHMIKGQTS